MQNYHSERALRRLNSRARVLRRKPVEGQADVIEGWPIRGRQRGAKRCTRWMINSKQWSYSAVPVAWGVRRRQLYCEMPDRVSR